MLKMTFHTFRARYIKCKCKPNFKSQQIHMIILCIVGILLLGRNNFTHKSRGGVLEEEEGVEKEKEEGKEDRAMDYCFTVLFCLKMEPWIAVSLRCSV